MLDHGTMQKDAVVPMVCSVNSTMHQADSRRRCGAGRVGTCGCMPPRAGLLLNTLSCIRGCELVFDSFSVLEHLLLEQRPHHGSPAAPDCLVRCRLPGAACRSLRS